MILSALFYIINDPFFWPSMSFTTIVGIFIGAVVHNGEVKQIKKTCLSILIYVMLVISVNFSRIFPHLDTASLTTQTSPQPLASTETILFVTIFYFFGMIVGVLMVKEAHRS